MNKIFIFVILTIIKLTLSVNSDEGTFLYFAYGSNLLAKRLHINNPSAVFYSTAKLKDFRLDFNIDDDVWNGAVATIVEDPGEIVWGDLWSLHNSDLKHLDNQEMAEGWYFAKNVTVTTSNGTDILARTYELVDNPAKLPEGEIIPPGRRPSITYLKVIIAGAIESNLPPEYIEYLKNIPTNGKIGTRKIRNRLGYPFNTTTLEI
ncbi:hypothetical protein O3G_MSEX006613 [Manduca sexta]|uniref:gamma-glutamylcyclotransferase n=1 Tax=Manduca sexta TaxID=7130 RepID=A0A921Z348_MANSE|nr:hypothetical protein O3G_MSEX006613 [Manduca sexta]